LLDKRNSYYSEKRLRTNNTKKRPVNLIGRFFYLKTIMDLGKASAIVVLMVFLGACTSQNEELLNLPKYEGPVAETYNVSMLYSDSAVVKLKVEAPVRFAYEN